ncbi:MAG: hypothetical protein HC808_18585 [Candidatus Competibacteraceae bacterium]|nr:hypothetical protein [Candidatus Competibacteraceae bacterium]
MTTTTNPADPTAKAYIHSQTGPDGSGESSFEKLLNRQMSEEERVHLRAVRDTLGLKPNDAMWLVFYALDYYRNLYSRFPP